MILFIKINDLKKRKIDIISKCFKFNVNYPGVVGDHPEYHLEDHSEKRLF